MRTPSIQPLMDKLAIGLSLACAIHCLVTPLLIILVPLLAATPLGGEEVHRWMLFVVLPTSGLAMFMGCRKHWNGTILVLAVAGLGLLVLAILVGEMMWGVWGERGMTLAGSVLLITAHTKNYRMCSKTGCNHLTATH